MGNGEGLKKWKRFGERGKVENGIMDKGEKGGKGKGWEKGEGLRVGQKGRGLRMGKRVKVMVGEK